MYYWGARGDKPKKQKRPMDLKFQWDDDKATLNLKNHQVSFDEARTIFDDPGAAIFYDEDHSIEENREVIVGHSARRRLLLVFFTQVAEDTIRIISARKATRTEQIDYEENANSQIPYRERNARRVSL